MCVAPGREKNVHHHSQENTEPYIQNNRLGFGFLHSLEQGAASRFLRLLLMQRCALRRKSMSVAPGREKNVHQHSQENAEHYIQNDGLAFGLFAD